ncbi:MAG: hypothetical protein D4R77_04920 [Planctomycetaceae bacterium]|nr:MAG: hypothetical protein D4R77_04920 [Planctomycetaceae bacterium]
MLVVISHLFYCDIADLFPDVFACTTLTRPLRFLSPALERFFTPFIRWSCFAGLLKKNDCRFFMYSLL